MATPTNDRTAVGLFTLTLGFILSSTPMGWFGWLVAGVVGTYLFPPKYDKPDKYTELGLNTAQSGIPIPLLYGTMRIGGNYIWKGPLYTKAIKSGGKGGGKQTTGYKYYMRAAIGIAEGEIKVTRVWKNNDLIRPLGLSSLTLYEGTADQATDPMISSYVDNPVPFRGLGYAALNLFYIGKNQASAPTFNFEAHRYPFNDSAGGIAYVPNYVMDNKLSGADDPSRGLVMRLIDSKMVMANATYLELWDKDLTEREAQTDISGTLGSVDRWFDMDVVETASGVRDVYIFCDDSSEHAQLHHYKLSEGGASLIVSTAIRAAATNSGRICHNDTYHYITYTYGSTTYFQRYNVNSIGTPLVSVDISADLGYNEPVNIACNDDYIFILADNGYVYSFDNTGTLVDSLNTLSAMGAEALGICCPYGMKGFVLVASWQTGDPDAPDDRYMTYGFGYYNDAGDLSMGDVYDGIPFWTNDQPVWGANDLLNFSDCLYRKISASAEGTLLTSIYVQSTPQGGIQHKIIDSNPAQVTYDIIVNVRALEPGIMNIASLYNLSDYCLENGLGISLLQNAEENLSDFLMNLLQYCHSIMFVNNVGEYQFKPFKNSDPSEATITEADIVADEYQKINVNLKERNAIPNRITIGYIDRLNNYVQGSFQTDHFLSQEEDGELIEQDMEFIWISNPIAAARHGYKIMKTCQYDTAVLSFPLMPKHLSRNVGDVITLALDFDELSNQRVRLLSLDEPDLAQDGVIKCVARIEEDYLNTFESYRISSSTKKNLSADPPTDIRPFVYEVPSLQSGDAFLAIVGGIRLSDSVVGADIYIADETLNYEYAGTLYRFAYIGDIDAAVDEVDTRIPVDVEDYADAIGSYTLEEQLNDVSFSVIGELLDDELTLDNLEFVSFQEVEVDGSVITLTNVHRGLYYTLPKDHTTAEVLCVMGDEDRFIAIPFVQADIGSKFYLKAQAFNYRGDEQNFDDLPIYEYTIKGLTKKAYHVSGLELENSVGDGLGSGRTTEWWDTPLKIRLRWQETFRAGGIDAQQIDEWPWDRFIDGDLVGYEALIYNSSMVLVATHTVTDGLANLYFDYTQTQMTTDFGGLQTHIFIGIRPYNGLGYHEDDVEIKEILIV